MYADVDQRVPFSHEAGSGRTPLRLMHLFLAAGLVVVLGLLSAGYKQAVDGYRALIALQQMHARAALLDRYQHHLLDAESSLHAYLMTGDAGLLSTYFRAQPGIAQSRGALVVAAGDALSGDTELVTILGLADATLSIMRDQLAAYVEHRQIDAGLARSGQASMNRLGERLRAAKHATRTTSEAFIATTARDFRINRWAIFLLAVAAMLLLVVLYMEGQRQQALHDRIAGMLHGENETLERKVKARTVELTRLASYLTTVREAEKASLARELHDELGALLTAARMDVSWLQRRLPKGALAEMHLRLARVQDTLASGITLKRRITHDLRPAMLNELGLVDSLCILADEFSLTDGIPVERHIEVPALTLDDAQTLALYRIVQEAFTNIRKYARARHVVLRMHADRASVRIDVEDDGAGFDRLSVSHASMGLVGMQHRAHMLAGRLDIVSAPGAGTCVTVEIPHGTDAAGCIHSARQARVRPCVPWSAVGNAIH